MFHHTMKSQGRGMLPVALLAAAAMLSACGHHSTNGSSSSSAGGTDSASRASAPHGPATPVTLSAEVAKTPTYSSAGTTAKPTPEGSGESTTQAAVPATTPAFKEVAPGKLLVTLAPTVKPTIHTYPGVTADILGIRIGMTVPQAEAIAAKTYPGKPVETKSSLSINHGKMVAQSQPFISKVVFQNGPRNTLTLGFTSPASGNVLYTISQDIVFNDTSKEPLVAAVTSDLIKKYGPPSSPFDYRQHWWWFGEQSLKPCSRGNCLKPAAGVVMGISSELSGTAADYTRAKYMGVGMEDYQLEKESVASSNEQLAAVLEVEQKALAKQVVPVQLLTGTYFTTVDTKPAGSMDFISDTAINIQSTDVKLQGTYSIDGHKLLIEAGQGSETFTIGNDGCLDGPDNSKFCKK